MSGMAPLRNATANCPGSLDNDFKGFSEGTSVFSLVLLVIIVVYYVGTVAWWLSMRRMDWIRQRSTLFMLMSGGGGLFSAVYLLLQTYIGPESFSCDVFLARFLSLPLVLAPVVVRLIIFHNKVLFGNLLVEQNLDGSPVEMFENLTMAQSVRVFFSYTFRGSKVATRGSQRATQAARRTQKERKKRGLGDAVGPALSEVEEQLEALNESRLLWRFFLTTKAFGLIIFSFLYAWSLAYTLVLIMQPGNGYGGHGCKGCGPTRGNGIFNTATLLIIAGTGALMLYRVRKDRDPLGIKKELRWCMYITAGVALVIFLLQADPGKAQAKGRVSYGVVVALALATFHGVQCPLQLVEARRRLARGDSVDGSVRGSMRGLADMAAVDDAMPDRDDASPKPAPAAATRSRTDKVTLEEVVQTRSGLRAWVQHLASEFSTENWWFYSSVGRYEAASDHERRAFAMRIHNTFVRERSLLQVNLPFIARKALDQAVAGLRADEAAVPPADFFAEAKLEVYRLMTRDSFSRFVKSPSYKEWRAQEAQTA